MQIAMPSLKYIEMEFVCEYPEGVFTLEKLREHGLGQVQLQARTNRQLQQYLDNVEGSLLIDGGEE